MSYSTALANRKKSRPRQSLRRNRQTTSHICDLRSFNGANVRFIRGRGINLKQKKKKNSARAAGFIGDLNACLVFPHAWRLVFAVAICACIRLRLWFHGVRWQTRTMRISDSFA